MLYTIVLDPRAIGDIQLAIDYYEEQQPGLGRKFAKELDKHFLVLERNPGFLIRYDDVRCLPLKKFPHMVHFTVNDIEQIVTVHAVFHTSLNPMKWKGRT